MSPSADSRSHFATPACLRFNNIEFAGEWFRFSVAYAVSMSERIFLAFMRYISGSYSYLTNFVCKEFRVQILLIFSFDTFVNYIRLRSYELQLIFVRAKLHCGLEY
jgi:hypothetical protein